MERGIHSLKIALCCWDLIKAKQLRHHQKLWKVLQSQSNP